MSDQRTCGDCRFAVLEDNGYSNYTVMGTDFSCAKRLHPDGTFDWFYGEDARRNYAQECTGYEKGEPIEVDVDGDAVPHEGDPDWEVWQMHLNASEASR